MIDICRTVISPVCRIRKACPASGYLYDVDGDPLSSDAVACNRDLSGCRWMDVVRENPGKQARKRGGLQLDSIA